MRSTDMIADLDVAECAACGNRHREVDVYPVGALADLHHAWRYLTARKFPATVGPPPWSWRISRAGYSLRHLWRTVIRQTRRRQWRDLKNTFNGYLAEPYHFPPGMTRCGTGWTRGRALRSMVRRGWPA